MPTYGYFCDNCNIETEEFHSMSDTTKRYCSKCGKELRRLIGNGAGIIFKGTGWFSKDYKKSNELYKKEK